MLTKMTFTIIVSIAYMLGLIIIFFSKSRVKNEETKAYRILIIANFIGLILHLLADFVSYHYDTTPRFLSYIVLKGMVIDLQLPFFFIVRSALAHSLPRLLDGIRSVAGNWLELLFIVWL